MASLGQRIDVWALSRGDSPALAGAIGEPLSYHGLFIQAREVSAALSSWGIGRGDTVAVVLPDGPEMAAAFLTIASTATVAPIAPGTAPERLAGRLDRLSPRAVVTLDGHFAPLRAAAAAARIPVIDLVPDRRIAGRFRLAAHLPRTPARPIPALETDVALLLESEAGGPDLTPLTHAAITLAAEQIRQSLGLQSLDCCLTLLPLQGSDGLIGAVLASIVAGGRAWCAASSATGVRDALEASHATWYAASPAGHRAMLDEVSERGLPERARLRFARACGLPLDAAVQQELERVLHVPVVAADEEVPAHLAISAPAPRARSAGSDATPAPACAAVRFEAPEPAVEATSVAALEGPQDTPRLPSAAILVGQMPHVVAPSGVLVSPTERAVATVPPVTAITRRLTQWLGTWRQGLKP